MGESIVILSSIEYYNKAREDLKEKDLLGFVSNISNAIVLSGNDKDMFSDATYLKAEGLFKLKQHKKALESVSEAKRFNTGEKVLRLQAIEGVIYGYLGELEKAERIFLDLLTEITDFIFSSEVYLDLV